jgi:hypothetical protein
MITMSLITHSREGIFLYMENGEWEKCDDTIAVLPKGKRDSVFTHSSWEEID